LKQHGTDENRFEREGDEFYRRIYEQYRAIAERERRRVVLLDEPGTIEQIGERIVSMVRERMELRTADGGVPGAVAV
jgi:dTMP kinase